MATTDLLHSNLTGHQLHEPKGVSTAEENTVYIADGNGSGKWKHMTFSAMEFELTTVSETALKDPPAVVELKHDGIARNTKGSLDSTGSSVEDSNFKELAVECEQLRNSLAIAHENLTALNKTVEDMRNALVTIGVLNG